jgi:hypothetical protein
MISLVCPPRVFGESFEAFLSNLVFEQPGSVGAEDIWIVVERDPLGHGFRKAIIQRGIEVCR